MPKPVYDKRKKPACGGLFIDVDNLSWEAISASVFPVDVLKKTNRVSIESDEYKEDTCTESTSETNRELTSKLGRYQDIDIADIANILTVFHGKEHTIYLMTHLQRSLEKLIKMREQDSSHEREVTKEDSEIFPAIIISSYTKEIKNRSIYERVGYVLHLIAIGLSIWWRCA